MLLLTFVLLCYTVIITVAILLNYWASWYQPWMLLHHHMTINVFCLFCLFLSFCFFPPNVSRNDKSLLYVRRPFQFSFQCVILKLVYLFIFCTKCLFITSLSWSVSILIIMNCVSIVIFFHISFEEFLFLTIFWIKLRADIFLPSFQRMSLLWTRSRSPQPLAAQILFVMG